MKKKKSAFSVFVSVQKLTDPYPELTLSYFTYRSKNSIVLCIAVLK